MELRPYKSIFGDTVDIPVSVYDSSTKTWDENPEWDRDLWVEREEDMYALIGLTGRTRVIRRSVYLRYR